MTLPPPGPDSIALVTGASSGIGEQYARQLSQRGYRVAIVARREDRLAALAEELGGSERAVPIAADLSVNEDRDRLAARLEQLGAHVNLLVNNAGFGIYQAFVDSGRERELSQLHVLVEATVDLMSRYLPAMVERREGAIINMSSSAGFQALPFNAGYAAAKSYILLLSEAVHVEVEEHGVTVTVVCPGVVQSDFMDSSDGRHFANRVPKFTIVSPERVAADALAAVEQGKVSVIPGGPQVRAVLAPNRILPRWVTMPVSKRLMAR